MLSPVINRRRTTSFLLSDFLTSDYTTALRLARRRHDIIPISLIDQRELSLPRLGLVTLQDLETGASILVDTSSATVQRQYEQRWKAALARRRQVFQSLGIDAIEVRTDTPALSPATHASPQSPQPLVQHKRSGAVQLTLYTDRQTMGFADWLRLTLVVDTPLDMAVLFPHVGNALGSFTIHSQRPIVSRTTSSRTRQWQQEYILAAERLGTLTIPPLTVTVQATNAASVAQPQRLTTEALTITVVPSLPDNADVTAPKDIAPPVLLERPGRRLWLWGIAGGLGLLAGAWWRYRRRRPNSTITLQPAHVLALEALQRLQTADLLSEQRTYLHYQGQEVRSHMQQSLLQELAHLTGGVYMPVGTPATTIARLYSAHIAPKARRHVDASAGESLVPRYHWFVLAALLLLATEMLVREKTPED